MNMTFSRVGTVLMIVGLAVTHTLAQGEARASELPELVFQDFEAQIPQHLVGIDLSEPLVTPNVTADGGALESLSAATHCNPIFERYPVAGPHNNGYDPNWWVWTCDQSNSNSDFSGAHLGNDIFALRGTPVVAAQAGTISWDFWNSTGGNVVYVVDACGWWHYYAHLDSVDPALYIGKSVMAGTRLGTIGNSGSASNTQPHLHYSTYPGNFYSGIDPFSYLYAKQPTSCQSGNSCSCLNGINVDGFSVPVTDTDCGHRVCGVNTQLWECGWSQNWTKVGGYGSCGNSCSCPNGKFKNGRDIPEHMTHCEFRVCGMNSKYWDCKPWGWHNTQISCN